MSLYYDALSVFENEAGQGGTLKSRIYNTANIENSSDDKKTARKSPPAQIYALITETRRWSSVLAEVIDRSEILKLERKKAHNCFHEGLTGDSKLTPQLALFLVHDLLLSKKAADDTSGKSSGVSGIAASAHHPLRLAIEKHKARLRAEFTKLRIKRGYASVKDFRAAVDAGIDRFSAGEDHVKDGGGTGYMNKSDSNNVFGLQSAEKVRVPLRRQAHPRWVRVNALKSTLEEQLRTTFAAYAKTDALGEVMAAPSTAKVLKIDDLVPDLLALPPNHELSANKAYIQGEIIVQDKASCFPALLLLPRQVRLDGDIIDACAAPGNKTTHLAALMMQSTQQQQQQFRGDEIQAHAEPKTKKAGKIFAFERDAKRTITLRKMVSWAGAGRQINIKGGSDFLKVNPKDKIFARVKAILLDPSCSGSGIVGRDDNEGPDMKMVLPASVNGLNGTVNSQNLQSRGNHHQHVRKKRKLSHVESKDKVDTSITAAQATNEAKKEDLAGTGDCQRLRSLSAFQLALLRHAMRFPSANRIVYSTCSVHWQENESVVRRALRLYECQSGGWKVQRRDEGQGVLKYWKRRGLRMQANNYEKDKTKSNTLDNTVDDEDGEEDDRLDDVSADACIRCMKDDGQGTIGFFVVAFVRHEVEHNGQDDLKQADEDNNNEHGNTSRDEEEEWEGFGDS